MAILPVNSDTRIIPAPAIEKFHSSLFNAGLDMHAILLGYWLDRDLYLLSEDYYASYKRDTLHRMFSITKSLTSMAVGQLICDNKVALNDKIINFFPEYQSPTTHEYISAMTIEDLLTMKTCHIKTTYKYHPHTNWVKSFFVTEPYHRQGKIFNYDTSASHVLSALVEKISQKNLLDYLNTSVFKSLALSHESHILKDPFGTSMGGSGLIAKPMDLLKIGIFLMNNYHCSDPSNQYARYIQQATMKHSDTSIHNTILEEQQGYGYQFWLTRHHGFACYGMGGQYIICLPDYNLLVVTTANTTKVNEGNQIIFDSIYKELLPYLV